NAAEKAKARDVLKRNHADLKRVKFHEWPTNRVWTRDSGPIFVRKDGGESPVAVTNWHFNAWAKYKDWKFDDRLPALISKKLKLPEFVPAWERHGKAVRAVLEGGSIDVNGRGLMLTTEECLLSRKQQRNPGSSREDLEAIFRDYLGVEKVI